MTNFRLVVLLVSTTLAATFFFSRADARNLAGRRGLSPLPLPECPLELCLSCNPSSDADPLTTQEALVDWLRGECTQSRQVPLPRAWVVGAATIPSCSGDLTDDVYFLEGIDPSVGSFVLAALASMEDEDRVEKRKSLTYNMSQFFLRRSTMATGGVRLRATGKNYSYNGQLLVTTTDSSRGYLFDAIATYSSYSQNRTEVAFPVGEPNLRTSSFAAIGLLQALRLALPPAATNPPSASLQDPSSLFEEYQERSRAYFASEDYNPAIFFIESLYATTLDYMAINALVPQVSRPPKERQQHNDEQQQETEEAAEVFPSSLVVFFAETPWFVPSMGDEVDIESEGREQQEEEGTKEEEAEERSRRRRRGRATIRSHIRNLVGTLEHIDIDRRGPADKRMKKPQDTGSVEEPKRKRRNDEAIASSSRGRSDGNAKAAATSEPSPTQSTESPPFIPGPTWEPTTTTSTPVPTTAAPPTPSPTTVRNNLVRSSSQIVLYALNKMVRETNVTWPFPFVRRTSTMKRHIEQSVKGICQLAQSEGISHLPLDFHVYTNSVVHLTRNGRKFDAETQLVAISALGFDLDLLCDGTNITAMSLLELVLEKNTITGSADTISLSRYPGGNYTDPTTMQYAILGTKYLLSQVTFTEDRQRLQTILSQLKQSPYSREHTCVVENTTASGLILAEWSKPQEPQYAKCHFEKGVLSTFATVLRYFNQRSLNPFSPWQQNILPTSEPPTTAEPTTHEPATTSSPLTPTPSQGTPSPPTPAPVNNRSDDGNKKIDGAAIAGGTAGGIAGVCVVAAVGLLLRSRFNIKKQEQLMEEPTENLGFY